jgi:iron(III) transport system ATP-binding protein
LRDKARSWLRQLQLEVGITTIFVTPDQIEALALSDRIAVMDKGRIVQIGTPTDIHERPATPFVADFIGTSNFLGGTIVESSSESATVKLNSGMSCALLRRKYSMLAVRQP